MRFIQHPPGAVVPLAAVGNTPAAAHVLEQEAIHAVNAALAARRPLLVRGEPGVGKTQLARAAAKALGRAYVPFVVDARTESRDLLWHFDAVERLAEAQLLGALGCRDDTTLRQEMAVERFLNPGPLWWAFDCNTATTQAGRLQHQPPPQPDAGVPENGCVVLIDEIDKAESDVPNGLLEALGLSSFTPQGRDAPVTVAGVAPLVVVTTNEERILPDAFLRRCLVLHLNPPPVERERDRFVAYLTERGSAHFADEKPADTLLTDAAGLVADDRLRAIERRLMPLPGVAEYLDLLRAVIELAAGDASRHGELLEQVAAFAVRKHPELYHGGAQG